MGHGPRVLNPSNRSWSSPRPWWPVERLLHAAGRGVTALAAPVLYAGTLQEGPDECTADRSRTTCVLRLWRRGSLALGETGFCVRPVRRTSGELRSLPDQEQTANQYCGAV